MINFKKFHLKNISRLRWITLFIFFILSTFGVYIFGQKLSGKYEIPVFACPINQEGYISGSCYTLSHFKDFFLGNFKDGNIGDIFFFLLFNLIVIILLGRLLCGFICPFGFIQDVLDKLRQFLKIKVFKFSEKQKKSLAVIRWTWFFIFIFGSFILAYNFCQMCPVVLFSPLIGGIGWTIGVPFIMGIIVIVGSFFKRRFWCFFCPLGLMLALVSKVSFVWLKKDLVSCTECGACYEACPMDIKSIYTERKKKNITTIDCIMCLECVNKCPEKNAISMCYMKKEVYKASRDNFNKHQGT